MAKIDDVLNSSIDKISKSKTKLNPKAKIEKKV